MSRFVSLLVAFKSPLKPDWKNCWLEEQLVQVPGQPGRPRGQNTSESRHAGPVCLYDHFCSAAVVSAALLADLLRTAPGD
jgi:hypothetical protein